MGSIEVQFADSTSYLQPQTNTEDCFLDDLISRHALTRPQHPAVCAWDGVLTMWSKTRDAGCHALGMGNSAMLNTGITFPPSQTDDSDECDNQERIAFHEMERIDPSEFDIVVEVCNHDGRNSCILKYWDSCLSEKQAADVASTCSTAVSGLLKQKQQTVARLDLSSDHDQGQIAQWNRNILNTIQQCVHELIQQRNGAQRDAVAVDAWDGQFTYGELDELSTQLALHLRSRGIGPKTIVPLCFAKCRWNPVAALGVMKAGGAFGLLDPAHPEQRLQDMCAQLGAQFIIASEDFQNLAGHLASEVLVLGNEQAQLWQNTGPNP
ncbi:uncharacterized protein CDV56_102894 [Aspergillus thermomutatus]|uniref:AMP-dependent synthetase/ligase domain-containing protein n=1 Tax=Aspergillus thermomutatus TaxID=41047 RepID=A0A397HF20_ASPTH|nr:uncharacterized protein CDV56_102894 [Aspergillus thermomutatus]RHZ61429.1 hypothetical protein CDV56_102894 [Aspergillus thermomutatus]